MKFSANHTQSDKVLPLPATLIHDLSSIFSNNSGVKFRTYSNFPFKNRMHRVLSSKDKHTLSAITKSNAIYIQKDLINNKPVLKVAIADFMSEKSCVQCHNNHKDKSWENNKWKIGDVRGVIEIITPLDKPLAQNKQMRNDILIFLSSIFAILIFYYSRMLVKREDELLQINDILDKRVKEEVFKNKEKEQIMLQKAKLSSMGEMINNIAHQWRQPISELSSILMNIDLKYNLNKINKDFMNQKINKAEVILEFMSSTIEDFRNFFKPDKQRTTFNINEIIENCLTISNITLSNNDIKIIKKIDKNLLIYGLKNELSHVVFNLISNAKDALIYNNIENPFIEICVRKNKNNVYISVEDNAKGIRLKNIQEIFEPYFSTKKDGSGIGLYISKIIIEKHLKGTLSVSNSKLGARFLITLLQS